MPVYCACSRCHTDQPEGRVEIHDAIGYETACARCKANHVRPHYAKDPLFRREKFDLPQPFEPPRPADATGTTEDDEDGG